ncbi:GDSL esterase/lipase LTL1-like isoform X2 [Aristolochia californica]|uniref:GDSL esterase/lipase LTL1-like isoform X2 n=1 Tax=Aristolochia californica TaxID=171875 RepID=UPI0035DE9159
MYLSERIAGSHSPTLMDSPLLLLVSVLALASLMQQGEARAFFVFGDSLVDSGNNNYLVTSARADSPPYGIDYPTHRATGRFSNGLNIPDIISEAIGEEPTLPYLSPELTGERLLVGANFASAGIGILNDTGIQFLNIIRIFQQIRYFQQYQARVSDLIGPEQTQQLVNRALVLITLGGNDFVNNYYLVPFSARSRQFSLPDYVRYLITEYRKILMSLYEVGARRVLVTGTGPLGCVPSELAQRGRNGDCAPELQEAAGLFNPQLENMLSELNSEYGADVFIAANTRLMQSDFVRNPGAYGGMLRPRALQRARTLHGPLQPLPQQGHLRFLGRLPPLREGEPPHRPADPERQHGLHEAHEPEHHPRHRRPD